MHHDAPSSGASAVYGGRVSVVFQAAVVQDCRLICAAHLVGAPPTAQKRGSVRRTEKAGLAPFEACRCPGLHGLHAGESARGSARRSCSVAPTMPSSTSSLSPRRRRASSLNSSATLLWAFVAQHREDTWPGVAVAEQTRLCSACDAASPVRPSRRRRRPQRPAWRAAVVGEFQGGGRTGARQVAGDLYRARR